jgi:hypothetical protein
MPFMLCRNRVRDFDAWQRVFVSHAAAHRDAGLDLVRLWRALDEPNNVFFLFELHDLERARAFVSAPGNEQIAEVAGVLDGEIHYLDEAVGY